jgi:hypothetical protein
MANTIFVLIYHRHKLLDLKSLFSLASVVIVDGLKTLP